MIHAISDIHGHYDVFMDLIKENRIIEKIGSGDKLVLLGDYIDRGSDSFSVLKYIYDMQKKYGSENIIVLRGNHEEAFIDYLTDSINYGWIYEDNGLIVSKDFLKEDELLTAKRLYAGGDMEKTYSYIRKCILNNNYDMISWLMKLPYYYETDTHIFVHAGICEEAGKHWKEETPDFVFLEKYPPSIGSFYKTIISGHVFVGNLAHDLSYSKPLKIGESHIFIDGGVEYTNRLILLRINQTSKGSVE